MSGDFDNRDHGSYREGVPSDADLTSTRSLPIVDPDVQPPAVRRLPTSRSQESSATERPSVPDPGSVPPRRAAPPTRPQQVRRPAPGGGVSGRPVPTPAPDRASNDRVANRHVAARSAPPLVARPNRPQQPWTPTDHDEYVAQPTRGGERVRHRRRRRSLPGIVLVGFLVAGLAIGYLVIERLGILDGTSTETSIGDETDGAGTVAETTDDEATETGSDEAAADDTAVDGTADSTADNTDAVAGDPDWPGGTGAVPDGVPQIRRAEIDPGGQMVLTGSAPNWETATKIVQFAGEKLPGGPDAVDNQLTWHPDADASAQWGDVVMDSAATFDVSGSVIDPESLSSLDVAAEMLIAHPTVFAVVIGHTDDSGDTDENNQLSADRASAVVEYLTEKGVVPGQIVVASAGSDDPTASNDTEEGRAENRRVEINFKNVLIPGTGFGES